ncbi:hypothetical protein BGW38_009799 [Lunasporangiospora selenospora]|uniref:DUF7905 domain-containing protein n=1 Tax=Lunasporangiospora selenospora TaxID=979761 RepID=A0A9P6KF60_9FUNG|nr:hypothetical protein BGW38_009799 [Lunasporangiospora selenospora]
MDVDDEAAQEWLSGLGSGIAPLQPLTMDTSSYWLVPPYVSEDAIDSRLLRIGEETGTNLQYSSHDGLIHIIGSEDCVRRATLHLDRLSLICQKEIESEQRSRRTTGWARPEREKTDVEKRLAKRREEEEMEMRKYQGLPGEKCPFTACFLCPSRVLITRRLGSDLAGLHPLRTECKSFIWIEDSELTAQHERILHNLEKPSKLIQIRLVIEPPAPYFGGSKFNNPPKFLKAEAVADYGNLVEVDLNLKNVFKDGRSDGMGGPHNQPSSTQSHSGVTLSREAYMASMKYMESIKESNTRRMNEALTSVLGHLRLTDHEIKMRIRLGQTALKVYPRAEIFQIEDLDTKVIQNERLESEFFPFFISSKKEYETILQKLGPTTPGGRTHDPETSWVLVVERMYGSHHAELQLDVTFRDNGKVALWNSLAEVSVPLEIRNLSSEKRYTWAWTIVSGRRLNADKFSPEGAFVETLTLEKR